MIVEQVNSLLTENKLQTNTTLIDEKKIFKKL